MSIQMAISELERAFYELSVLFPTKLAVPVITIQTQGRSRRLGWFCGDKWSDDFEKIKRPEINICAEELARGTMEILKTLTHEMVHHSNFIDKINDCSSNQYHNRRFADRAEMVGLLPQKGYRGWSQCEVSEDLLSKFTKLEIDEEAFTLFRQSQISTLKGPTKLKKWSCQCTNVRVATKLDAVCNRCGQPFVNQGC